MRRSGLLVRTKSASIARLFSAVCAPFSNFRTRLRVSARPIAVKHLSWAQIPIASEVKLTKVPHFQRSHYDLSRLQHSSLRCASFDGLRDRWPGLRVFPD